MSDITDLSWVIALFLCTGMIIAMTVVVYRYRRRVVRQVDANYEAHSVIAGRNELLLNDLTSLAKGTNTQGLAISNIQSNIVAVSSRIQQLKSQITSFADSFQISLTNAIKETGLRLSDVLEKHVRDTESELNTLQSELKKLQQDNNMYTEVITLHMDIGKDQFNSLQRTIAQNRDMLDVLRDMLGRVEMYMRDIDMVRVKVNTLVSRTSALNMQDYTNILETTQNFKDHMDHINNASTLYLSKTLYDELLTSMRSMASDIKSLNASVISYVPAADMKDDVMKLGQTIDAYQTTISTLKTDIFTFDIKEYERRITALKQGIDILSTSLQIQDISKDINTRQNIQALTQLEKLRQEVTEHSLEIKNLSDHLALGVDSNTQKIQGRISLDNKLCMDDPFVCIDGGVMKDFLQRTEPLLDA